MRTNSPATSSNKALNDGTTRPHIVRSEMGDGISLFESEETPANRRSALDAKGPSGNSVPTLVSKMLMKRSIFVALLAAIVATQAGVIALWILSNRADAAPDDGQVTVTSEPSGSPVTIDGTARGVTPLSVSLVAGAHRIDVGSSGQVRGQTLSVTRGGAASLHFALATPPAVSAITGKGGLRVVTEPPGARVWVDGEPRGVAPLTVSDLPVGEHAVSVRSRSGEAVNRRVNVDEATVGSLIISLNSSAAFASGWLAVTSDVPLQITENGTVVGTTDAPRILLPAGAHQLDLVNASLDYRVARSVKIDAGQTTTVSLAAPMGRISINALPWAEVFVDGQRAGETPLGNFSVPIGNRELLFKHPELGERRRAVTVGALNPQRVSVDMRKP